MMLTITNERLELW